MSVQLLRSARRLVQSASRPTSPATRPARRYISYGFVGLGRMGYPMATNLLRQLDVTADHLTIYDVNTAALETFLSTVGKPANLDPHITAAKSLDEIAQCDVVVTMLPLPAHVEQTYQTIVSNLSHQSSKSNNNSNSSSSKSKIFIDCSTIDPMTSNRVAATIPSGSLFVDAPVSGGVVGANKATLTFMVGGASGDGLKAVESTLSKLGSKIVNCGPQGSGLVAKLANNYLLAVCNIATCEAFHLAAMAGLDLGTFASIVNSSSGANWSSIVNNPVPNLVATAPASRNYDNGFGIQLMKKDIGLVAELAKENNTKFLLADRVDQIYAQLENDQTLKNKDLSVVYKYLQDHE